MFKVGEDRLKSTKASHPGFIEMVNHFENADIPICPFCGSNDTATVNVGIIRLTMYLTMATTKFHLRANERPGDYYCNACKKYY